MCHAGYRSLLFITSQIVIRLLARYKTQAYQTFHLTADHFVPVLDFRCVLESVRRSPESLRRSAGSFLWTAAGYRTSHVPRLARKIRH